MQEIIYFLQILSRSKFFNAKPFLDSKLKHNVPSIIQYSLALSRSIYYSKYPSFQLLVLPAKVFNRILDVYIFFRKPYAHKAILNCFCPTLVFRFLYFTDSSPISSEFLPLRLFQLHFLPHEHFTHIHLGRHFLGS